MAYFNLAKLAVVTVCFLGAFSVASKTQPVAPASNQVAEPSVITKLNVNLASVEQLVKLKGIGPKKAKAIVEYIQLNGKLVALDELLEIRGIGKGLLKKLESQLSL